RAQVERGREDFEAARVLFARDVLGDAAGDLSSVLWAQSAAEAFREAINTEDLRESLAAAVAEVARDLDPANESSVTRPEVGDVSIRERYVETRPGRYRVLYDTWGSRYRVLWFTNNTTCYRNVRSGLS